MFEKIEEIENIRQMLKRITYNTWLVLDLDNTVMESSLELGGDQWFTSLLHHAEIVGSNKELTVAAVIAIYHAVQEHVRTQAVEPSIVAVIRALQDIGVPILALTARDHSIRFSTIRQLSNVGIDFSRNPVRLRDGSTFDQGIIFCSGGNKGEALREFLCRCIENPDHIVMLDDKEKHLQHVKTALKSLRIPFAGLRYGFLDEKILQFNSKAASHQLACLKPRLPKAIQDTIDSLKITTDDLLIPCSPSPFSHGFFDSPIGCRSLAGNAYPKDDLRSRAK